MREQLAQERMTLSTTVSAFGTSVGPFGLGQHHHHRCWVFAVLKRSLVLCEVSVEWSVWSGRRLCPPWWDHLHPSHVDACPSSPVPLVAPQVRQSQNKEDNLAEVVQKLRADNETLTTQVSGAVVTVCVYVFVCVCAQGGTDAQGGQ